MIPEHILPLIPGCEDGRPPLVVWPLTGGRGCNAIWRVETPRGRFVLRQRGEPVDRPGSLSRNELLAHRTAARAGLAPALIHAAADGRWLLMEYIAGDPWSAAWLQSPWGLAALGGRLQKLRLLVPPDGAVRVDPAAIAQGYLQQIRARGADLARQADAQWRAMATEVASLAGVSRPMVLNHGDLQAPNLLGPDPMLVDWEYSQWADPAWDAACLLDYYPELQPRRDAVLEACGLESPEDREILSLHQTLFSRLNALWRLAQGQEPERPAG